MIPKIQRCRENQISPGGVSDENDVFDAGLPARPTVLQMLQNDILLAQCRPNGATTAEDDSIIINNCHSPKREVEVLHDQLLEAISRHDLQCRDIIITAPNINTYAPLINLVFGSGPLQGQYRFNDREITGVSPVAELLRQLPDLTSGRGEVSALCKFFSAEPVRDAWEIAPEDLSRLEDLLTTAGIAWGRDAEERKDVCGNPFGEYSWQDGIDRLMAGFAMGEQDDGRLAATPVKVDRRNIVLLGKLSALSRGLFALRDQLRRSHLPLEWNRIFADALDLLCGNSAKFHEETALVKKELRRRLNAAEVAEFRQLVSLGTIQEEILQRFSIPDGKAFLLRGKITCCSLVPMRSIPAKLIAVLGLNDGEFPRRDPDYSFSFLRERRFGETTKILEDRYLFLETLLSARTKLILSYCGQSTTGDKDPIPSSALTRLMDYLRDAFGVKAIPQKLQGFDVKYFSGSDRRYFSYSEVQAETCRQFQNHNNHRPEIHLALPESAEKCPEELPLDHLLKLIYHPTREFLRRNLQLVSHRDLLRTLSDTEPDAISFDMAEELLGRMIGDAGYQPNYDQLSRQRQLPVGVAGKQELDKLLDIYRRIPAEVSTELRETEKQLVDVFFGGHRLYGFVHANPQGGIRTFSRYAPNAYSMLKLYLEQLVLTVQYDADQSSGGWLYSAAKGKISHLPRFSRQEARDRLQLLLDKVELGYRRPLALFPKSAYAYVEAKDEESGHLAALNYFESGTYDREPEAKDQAIRAVFPADALRNAEIWREFSDNVRAIYGFKEKD